MAEIGEMNLDKLTMESLEAICNTLEIDTAPFYTRGNKKKHIVKYMTRMFELIGEKRREAAPVMTRGTMTEKVSPPPSSASSDSSEPPQLETTQVEYGDDEKVSEPDEKVSEPDELPFFELDVEWMGSLSGDFTLTVLPSYTFDDLRIIVLNQTGLHPHSIHFFHEHEELFGTLQGNEITDMNTIQMAYIPFLNDDGVIDVGFEKFPLQVFARWGGTSTIKMLPDSDVSSLVAVLHSKGLVGCFKMEFAGKRLEVGSKMKDYNIQNGSTLQLTRSLQGGGKRARVVVSMESKDGDLKVIQDCFNFEITGFTQWLMSLENAKLDKFLDILKMYRGSPDKITATAAFLVNPMAVLEACFTL